MATKPNSKLMAELLKRTAKTPMPDLAQVAARFVHHAGGTDNLARLLWEEWTHSSPGSLIRGRILEVVVKAMRGAESRIGEGSLSDLPDSEIENILAQVLSRESVSSAAAARPAAASAPDASGQVQREREQAAAAEEADPDLEAPDADGDDS